MSARWERFVNAPQQQRARDSFERVLQAGADVLVESGYEGFSIGEVCRRAGVAPGTLYGRVETKDHLFLALHGRELDRIGATGEHVLADDAAWPAGSGAELVDRVVDFLGRHFTLERRLLAVFMLRAAVDPQVRAEGASSRRRLEAAVVARLATRRDAFPHPDPDSAMRTATRTVLDSLSWRTAFGEEPDPTEEGEWTARLREVARSYLLTPPSAPSAPSAPSET